jgi:hypothetical protein
VDISGERPDISGDRLGEVGVEEVARRPAVRIEEQNPRIACAFRPHVAGMSRGTLAGGEYHGDTVRRRRCGPCVVYEDQLVSRPCIERQ